MVEEPRNRHGITLRGDSLYCPLPLSIEPYWWCEIDCHHCYFRGLNHVWGKELRPINLDALERKLINGLKNQNPKSKLAYCLLNKKTIRLGNKTDPFQPVEKEYKRSLGAMNILRKLNWTFVVQTRFTDNLEACAFDSIRKANRKRLITLLPVISPGMDRDWEIFERKRTTPVEVRLKNIAGWLQEGIPVGVNGEPFIPGHHTLREFEDTLKALKAVGVDRYNTYNFHFTPYVAKRLINLPGVDIEKIWKMNQDKEWKKILKKLLELGTKHGVKIGCPDFVNSGPKHQEPANTCCGIDVQNPCTFNSHYFKKRCQEGMTSKQILKDTFDNSGDFVQGLKIIEGKPGDFYSLKDAKLI